MNIPLPEHEPLHEPLMERHVINWKIVEHHTEAHDGADIHSGADVISAVPEFTIR
jgi:hypothetical protein